MGEIFSVTRDPYSSLQKLVTGVQCKSSPAFFSLIMSVRDYSALVPLAASSTSGHMVATMSEQVRPEHCDQKKNHDRVTTRCFETVAERKAESGMK